MTQKYIGLQRYIELNSKHPSVNQDNRKTRWYQEVIQDSAKNKMELIVDNPEFAYQTFVRYEDAEGFRLMIENANLNPETEKIVKMQLESVLNAEKTPDFTQSVKTNEPLSKKTLEERQDVKRAGHSPTITDIVYEGSIIN